MNMAYEVIPEMKNSIKKYREAAGITQEQLADAVGYSRSMITRYENGTIVMNMRWLGKIADHFKISIAELIDDPDKPRIAGARIHSDVVFMTILEKVVDMARSKPKIEKEQIVKIARKISDIIHNDTSLLNSSNDSISALVKYEFSKQLLG